MLSPLAGVNSDLRLTATCPGSVRLSTSGGGTGLHPFLVAGLIEIPKYASSVTQYLKLKCFLCVLCGMLCSLIGDGAAVAFCFQCTYDIHRAEPMSDLIRNSPSQWTL